MMFHQVPRDRWGRLLRTAVVVLLSLVGLTLAGCAFPGGGNTPSPTTTSVSPALLRVPNVVGQNAAVAKDTLHRAGFKNVDLGTVDGRPVVVLPQNWTVRTQSAAAGSRLAPDAKIVLGCVRNGGAPRA